MSAPAAFDPDLFASILKAYRRMPATDLSRRWLLLETAHVVGQTRWLPHTRVHGLMLALAWRTCHWGEVGGQLLRLALVPLGHALGRLPLGNPGTSRVGALQPLPVAPEIAELMAKLLAELREAQRASPDVCGST